MIIKVCVGLLVATITTAATAQPVYRPVPISGVRHYSYQVLQTINGTMHKGYRTKFDIQSKGGELFAIVRSTSELDGGSWKPVTPDAACKKAMHGGTDSIARVKLYPLGNNAHNLGASFLDLCAPQAVFFPLTDILNAAMIPLPGTFNATKLRKLGDAGHLRLILDRQPVFRGGKDKHSQSAAVIASLSQPVELLRSAHRLLEMYSMSPIAPDSHVKATAPAWQRQRRIMALGLLAPSLQKAVLQGTYSPSVNHLLRELPPLAWSDQCNQSRALDENVIS